MGEEVVLAEDGLAAAEKVAPEAKLTLGDLGKAIFSPRNGWPRLYRAAGRGLSRAVSSIKKYLVGGKNDADHARDAYRQGLSQKGWLSRVFGFKKPPAGATIEQKVQHYQDALHDLVSEQAKNHKGKGRINFWAKPVKYTQDMIDQLKARAARVFQNDPVKHKSAIDALENAAKAVGDKAKKDGKTFGGWVVHQVGKTFGFSPRTLMKQKGFWLGTEGKLGRWRYLAFSVWRVPLVTARNTVLWGGAAAALDQVSKDAYKDDAEHHRAISLRGMAAQAASVPLHAVESVTASADQELQKVPVVGTHGVPWWDDKTYTLSDAGHQIGQLYLNSASYGLQTGRQWLKSTFAGTHQQTPPAQPAAAKPAAVAKPPAQSQPPAKPKKDMQAIAGADF